ncbi:ATP-binding protein [uncultured Cohaesibacter sp.]|uniref:AAA family ATPase n=1 Tax=uncultured Cohaesibacter sp. TaxID=1002546 RepID=UPI0029C9A273|nr:ATP-binding protein [uncultured Cohaesibacter sp.]
MMEKGTLVFFCGKMGAGKSTRAKAIAAQMDAILIEEDDWLAALFPDQIRSVPDYVRLSGLLKPQIKKLAKNLLTRGQDVVLDFPANTVEQRAWLKGISDEVGAGHLLHFLDVQDDVCLAQIRERVSQQPKRAKTDTEEMFFQMARYFEPPLAEEGLTIVTD